MQNSNIEHWKEQIITDSDIEAVFGDIENLKKTGSDYKGRCPFHEDKTPSFSITRKYGHISYKCFGCNQSGDVISYVEKKHNTDFTSAVKIISELTHYPLPLDFKDNNEKPSKIQTEFNKFNKELLENKTALKHLESRGVKDFELFGYDSKTGKYKIAYYKGYKLDNIISYDTSTEPKYLFQKGITKDYPFNLSSIRDNTEIWLTEGVFDAICLQQNFNKNAVSILGNRLLANSIPHLKRYNNIILALDNDRAGYNGTKDAMTSLYKSGFKNVFYIPYSDFKYKDINDALQKGEGSLIERLLEKTEHAYKFLTNDFILETQDLNDLEKSKATDSFLNMLYLFPDSAANGCLTFYKLKTGLDLKSEYEKGKSLLNIERYQQKLSDIINTKRDFTEDTLYQIKELTAETQIKSHTITPYTADEFLKDLAEPLKRIQSTLLPDIYFYAGALSFIAGRTSHGKTTFLINECVRQTEEGRRCAFISLEENRTFVAKKLLIAYNNNCLCNLKDDENAINTSKFLTLELSNYDYKAHSKAVSDLFSKVMIFDVPDRIEALEKLILALYSRENVKVFFIDYIQLIYFENQDYNKMVRQEQIKHINKRLLNVAKEHDLHIILGAQFNRTVSKESEIFTTNIYREAGDIEQDANVLINIWNKNFNDKPFDDMLYYIAKNRNGKAHGKYISKTDLKHLRIDVAFKDNSKASMGTPELLEKLQSNFK